MKKYAIRVGDRVRCGERGKFVESLATVRSIIDNGMVIAVEYDDTPGEMFYVHKYDTEQVPA